MLLRVVLDANVAISGLLWPGVPAQILNASAASFTLLSSEALLSEIATALERPKFGRRLSQLDRSTGQFVDTFRNAATLVTPSTHHHDIRDPNDLKVIQAAIGGHADLIVTNDADLLVLGSVEGVGIIRPVDFLHTLGIHTLDQE